MPEAVTILSERLRVAREAAGLTLAELGRRAAVREDVLRRFEAGTIAALTTGTLARLAELLRVPRVVLLDPSAPFDMAETPHTLLKTAGVRGYGHLAPSDEEALASALARARAFIDLRASLGRRSLLTHFASAPAPETNAHEAGYQDAGRVRELLVGREGVLFRLRRMVEDSFGILVGEVEFADTEVVGAACRLGEARVIAVRRGLPTETWRRFVIGHELEHHLRDLGPAQGEISTFAVSTRFDMEPPPLEKRANAFSAMLLAPAAAVRSLLGEPQGRRAIRFDVAREWSERVSSSCGIGFAATAWHLRNLGYYDGQTAQTLVSLADAAAPTGFEEDSPFDGLEREVFAALSEGSISLGRARDLVGSLVDRWQEEQQGDEGDEGLERPNDRVR